VIRKSFYRKDPGQEITLFAAGGDNNGEVVGLSQGRVEDNVVVYILSVVVTHDAQ